jgi:hypothetical protein
MSGFAVGDLVGATTTQYDAIEQYGSTADSSWMAALGNYTKSCSESTGRGKEFDLKTTDSGTESGSKKVKIWSQVDHASKVLPRSHRTSRCMLCAVSLPDKKLHLGNDTTVRTGATLGVTKSGSLSIKGVLRCGCVWACPRCARIVSARRSVELREGLEYLSSNVLGARFAHVVITTKHSKWDNLEDVNDRVKSIWRRMRSGRDGKAFNDRYDVLGSVRCIEVRHGKNGWHPHIHVVLAYCGVGDPTNDLMALYESRAKGFGLKSVGINVELVSSLNIADYITKYGVGLASEITSSNTKTGQSRSPWDLLEDSKNGDAAATELYLEYTESMHGQRQLYYSPGLKKLMGITKESTDEEIAEKDEIVEEIERSWDIPKLPFRLLVRRLGFYGLSTLAHAKDFDSLDDHIARAMWDSKQSDIDRDSRRSHHVRRLKSAAKREGETDFERFIRVHDSDRVPGY